MNRTSIFLVTALASAGCTTVAETTDDSALTTSGSLSAPAGASHDCWTNGAHAATSCVSSLQTASGSDGTYQVTLSSFAIGRPNQSVGLMLFQDDQNFIRFELWTAGSGVFANSYAVLAGAGTQKISGANVGAPTSVVLQVVKAGSTYTYKYSLDNGATFTTAGSFTAALTVRDVGPYVDNSGAGTNAPAISANFSGLQIPGTAAPLATGTYFLESGTSAVDGGFGVYNNTPAVQLYALNSGVDQEWTYTADQHLANVGFSGHQMADAGNGTVSEPTAGDTWTIAQATGGYTIRDNRTGNYLENISGTLAMGVTQTVWKAQPVSGAVNGSCGSANGVAVASAPSANLCAAGSASAVAGSGPFTWTCAGSNGGTTASCSAPLSSGGFTPIANVTAGAQIVHPTDSVATITSVIQACATHTVHFAAGTYTLSNPINVPSNCQIEGELGWTSVITSNQTSPDSTVFQLDTSSNVTITRLNFQNIGHQVISNQYSNGNIHNVTTDNTHIYLNNFDRIGYLGTSSFGGEPAVWIWDPHNAVIERNACNKVLGDCFHLYSTDVGIAYVSKFADTSAVVRWNFASHQDNGAQTVRNSGYSMMEIQSGSQGALIYQNVFYSKDYFVGGALSIADGGVPCTGGSLGAFTGCQVPLYNGGQTSVVIDGNIVLNNGANGPSSTSDGGIETMGVTPLFQNNFIRGWGSLSYAGYMFVYNAGAHQFTQGATEPVYFQDNTGCDILNGGSSSRMLTTDDSKSPVAIGAGNNTYQATCASIAPPALPPQIVVSPEMLDSSGGLEALQPGNYIAGPNTYWPNANRYLNYAY